MKQLNITYEDKEYPVQVLVVEAYASGYFKIEWENETLQEILASPIYIEYKNGNGMVLPPTRNGKQLALFASIAQGIFIHYFNNQTV